MLLTLTILLKGKVYSAWLVGEELTVHSLDGCISRLKAIVRNKPVAQGSTSPGVTGQLRGMYNGAEDGESVKEDLLINAPGIQVTDEEVGPNIQGLGILLTFVDTNRPAMQMDTVHNPDGIVSILLRTHLYKGKTLVHLGDPVLWHKDPDHWACLGKEFGQELFVALLLHVSHIDGGLLVSFNVFSYKTH